MAAFSCHLCRKTFQTLEKLTNHSNSHTRERPFKCSHPDCGKAFISKYKLMRHMATHSPQKLHRCTQCDKTFNRKDHLKNHLQTHDPNKRAYECSECGKKYYTLLGYKRHVALHSASVGDLTCGLCAQELGSMEVLLDHLKDHAEEKQPGSSKEKEKKHRCDQCSRSFYTRKDVRRHLVVHTGCKDFLCQFCAQRFGRKDHLTRHTKKTHSQELLRESQQAGELMPTFQPISPPFQLEAPDMAPFPIEPTVHDGFVGGLSPEIHTLTLVPPEEILQPMPPLMPEPLVTLHPMVDPGSPPPVLQSPVLQSPVIQGPVIQGPVIQGPVIQGPVIEGPVIEGPVIQGPVIEGPVIQGPVIEGPVIQGPVIEGPVIQGPVIEGPVIEGPVIEGPVIEGPVIEGPVIEGQILQGQILQGQVLQGQLLQGQVLQGQLLQGQVLQGQLLQGQLLQGQLLQGQVLQGQVLQGQLLQGQVLQGQVLQGQVLQGQVLQGPVLQNPVLQSPVLQSPVLQSPVLQSPVLQSPVLQSPVLQSPVLQSPVLQGPVEPATYPLLASMPFGADNKGLCNISVLEELPVQEPQSPKVNPGLDLAKEGPEKVTPAKEYTLDAVNIAIPASLDVGSLLSIWQLPPPPPAPQNFVDGTIIIEPGDSLPQLNCLGQQQQPLEVPQLQLQLQPDTQLQLQLQPDTQLELDPELQLQLEPQVQQEAPVTVSTTSLGQLPLPPIPHMFTTGTTSTILPHFHHAFR